jgi:hypothetical protein
MSATRMSLYWSRGTFTACGSTRRPFPVFQSTVPGLAMSSGSISVSARPSPLKSPMRDTQPVSFGGIALYSTLPNTLNVSGVLVTFPASSADYKANG